MMETRPMANTPLDALHQVHTATNDVLTGYETMMERAEPEIGPILADLTALHVEHAAALRERLRALGHTGEDDTSFRGTMNSVAVTMRDWITGLDEGSLDAVERGEKALQYIYDDAQKGWSSVDDLETATLLDAQYQEIGEKVAELAAR